MPSAASCPASAMRLNAALFGMLVAGNLLLLLVIPAWLLRVSPGGASFWCLSRSRATPCGRSFTKRFTATCSRSGDSTTGPAACSACSTARPSARFASLTCCITASAAPERDRTEVYDPARVRVSARGGLLRPTPRRHVFSRSLELAARACCPRPVIDRIAPASRSRRYGWRARRPCGPPARTRSAEMRVDMLAIIFVFGVAAWLYEENAWMLGRRHTPARGPRVDRRQLVPLRHAARAAASRDERRRPRWVAALLASFQSSRRASPPSAPAVVCAASPVRARRRGSGYRARDLPAATAPRADPAPASDGVSAAPRTGRQCCPTAIPAAYDLRQGRRAAHLC